MTIVRWAILVPCVVLTFMAYVALAVGIFWFADLFCPAELRVSEQCTANYMQWTKETILFIIPAIAAATMVWLSYRIAPNHKLIITVTTTVLGSIAALYYALDSGYWWTLALTELAAVGVTYWAFHQHTE